MKALGIDREFPANGSRVGRPPGRRHDDLADVAGALHQPERTVHVAAREDTVWQRDQLAVGKEPNDIREESLGDFPVLAEKLVDVDSEVG